MRTQRSTFSLLPAIALGALALLASLPSLAGRHVIAASPERFATVTVESGQTVWAIAARRTSSGGNVQDMVDRIIAVNHLNGASVSPGQELRIPD